MEAPFDSLPHWDDIVFHSHAMLPEGLVLPIAKDRFFYIEGKDFSPASKVTWTYWTASGDRLCSSWPPHEPLVPFLATDIRANLMCTPAISSLAMAINAHAKLQQFMREHGASATPRVQKFTQLIAELVHEIFFVPPGFKNAAAGEHLTDEESEAKDAKGEAEDEDGLTDSEFQLVSQRARDPNLNGEERTDAAMMMIFGHRR